MDPGLASLMATAGTPIGWLLAAARRRRWLAAVLTGLIGLSLASARIGGFGELLLEIGGQALQLRAAIWRWIFDGSIVEFAPFLASIDRFLAAAGVFLGRWLRWSVTWLIEKPPVDPVAAVLTWSIGIWIVAAWAGWVLRVRSKSVKALLPAGLLLSITLAFAGTTPTPLYWFLLILVPIMGLTAQEARLEWWRKSGVRYHRALGRNLALASVLVSVVLVIAALITQPLSIQKLVQLAQDFSEDLTARREQVAESLGVEQQPVGSPPNQAELLQLRHPGLPRSHLIGSGPELSGRTVMTIRTSDLEDSRPLLDPEELAQRYYWRSNTYDRYTGRGWWTGETETEHYAAGDVLHVPERPEHRLLTQEITSNVPAGGKIFAAGDVVTVDHPYSVEWRSDDDAFGAMVDRSVNRVRIASLVSQPTEDDLRAAGTDYPAWVEARYLSLPEILSDRVLTLARDLTATAPTPYDRALSIESYLREIPYSLDVPTPPADKELVDYFLFDLQKGYCDYYATSMVVLARASGIPARIAVGYLPGTFEATQNAYIVTEADAHSWVEVYFPGIGWVDFEPTGGRPSIARSGSTVSLDSTDLNEFMLSIDRDQPGRRGEFDGAEPEYEHLLWLAPTVAAIVLAILALIQRWRVLRMPLAEYASRIFRGLRSQAKRMGLAVHPGTTASELSRMLREHMARFHHSPRLARWLRPAAAEIEFLSTSYVRLTYDRPSAYTRIKKADMLQSWRKLRWRLGLARMAGLSQRTEPHSHQLPQAPLAKGDA